MEMKKSDQVEQAKVCNVIFGFADSLVIKCAVKLEIADTIHKHGEPMTLSELASQLPQQPIDTDRLFRIMRYLVQMKFFKKETSQSGGEIKYGLSPLAKYLVRGWRNSMVAQLLVINDEVMISSWYHLKDDLSGECDPFEKASGKKIWDYMSENPEKSQIFNEAMAGDTNMVIYGLVNNCKNVFEGIKTLVDVGGGNGTAMKAISNAFPDIKCIVYDLPHVIADSTVVDLNIDRIEGDMFKFIPNADAIYMKCILHDWKDEECIQILKQCKKALPHDGGKLIIVEIVLNADSEHPLTKMRLTSDLEMLVNTGGKERTEEEWKKLFEAAGFNRYKIIEMSTLQSVIEVYSY